MTTVVGTRARAGARGRPAASLRRPAAIGRRLAVADACGATAAVLAVSSAVDSRAATLAALAFVLSCAAAAHAAGLDGRRALRIRHSTIEDLPRLLAVVTAASWIFVVARSLLSLPALGATTLLALWGASFAFVAVARTLAHALVARGAPPQKTLVLGAGDVGQLVARKLQHHPEYGLRLEGLVDDGPRARRADLEQMTILGGVDELPRLVDERGIERIVVAFSQTPEPQVLDLVRSLVSSGVSVDVVPRLFETLSPDAALDSLEGLPLVSVTPRARPRRYAVAKRALDVAGALVGLALALPLMLFVAWRIRRDSPGPILFRQRRWGMDMREFTSLKFRTMKVGTSPERHRAYIREALTAPTRAEDGLFKLEREDAVTNVGRWLRRTSLDELPQLFNVLRGDMSLVGPRPCIPYEAEYFAPHHFERFSVPQGLTGLWQVTARAHATFAEALELDVAYARGCSFWVDLKLILLTPVQMLRQGTTR